MSTRNRLFNSFLAAALSLMVVVMSPTTVCAHPTDSGAPDSATGTSGSSEPAGADASSGAATIWDSLLVSPPAPPTPPQAGVKIAGHTFKVTESEVFIPRREDITVINFGPKYVNVIFGGLEQGASNGFGVQLTTADKIPGVEFSGTAIVSFKLYRRFELAAYIPKIGDENTHARFSFDYIRRTKDNFFGIGPRTPEEDQTNFDHEDRIYSATVSHDFTKELRVGAYVSGSNTAIYEGDSDQSPSTDQVFSGDPNVIPVTRYAPGLNGGSRLIKYGVGAELDMRDNSKGLAQGGYLFGRIYSADGLEKENTFSDFGWLGGEFDGRVYIPLFGDKTSLALRGAGDFKNPKGGSQIPFYEMSFLGGRRYVRGFDTYRFRGNNSLLFQTELRRTVWTKDEDSGADVYGLTDGGAVWGDDRSSVDPVVLENDELKSRNWRFGFGGGVQYRYSAAFAARFEFATSNEGTKVYFKLSRGF